MSRWWKSKRILQSCTQISPACQRFLGDGSWEIDPGKDWLRGAPDSQESTALRGTQFRGDDSWEKSPGRDPRGMLVENPESALLSTAVYAAATGLTCRCEQQCWGLLLLASSRQYRKRAAPHMTLEIYDHDGISQLGLIEFSVIS